jgi:hypothetical protein
MTLLLAGIAGRKPSASAWRSKPEWLSCERKVFVNAESAMPVSLRLAMSAHWSTALDNGRGSPRKLLRGVVAGLRGRKA